MNTSKEPAPGGEDPADDSRTGDQGDQPAGPEPQEGSPEDRTAREHASGEGPSGSDSPEAEPDPQSLPENTDEERERRGIQSSDPEEEDELPEWEPLTPELVEDEAIRGDFMLRWAVVLLAFLLGCTEISESQTLVHLKAGDYMADHGWFPPGQDVFSSTATERPWVNLAWLLDLVLAGLFSLGSQIGLGGGVVLSVVKALAAAVTFGLIVHISRPGVSTWWGAICAALALLSSYPQFTARPEAITLLGLGVTLWLLYRWRETGHSGTLWVLPAVFLLWSNLDPRMFLGLALLLLYGGGEALGYLFGRPDYPDGSQRTQFWMVVGVCVVASLVNPFGWHSLAAPVSLYGVEYPALRAHYGGVSSETFAYFSMTDPAFWTSVTHHTVAGLLVLAATLVTLALNWRRAKPSHVAVFAGFVGFAIVAGHELAAASLVACVLATLNGQEWYRSRFRQTYSVEVSELVFSRGGRALTVLMLFAVAYLAISGWLDGPQGRRTGVGMHAALQARIDGLRADLEDSLDRRPFNFRLRQGDVLIWIGQQPFVDHRVALYHGAGEKNLLQLHDRTRRSLRKAHGNDEYAGRRDIWQETFDRFKITHVLPRLSPPHPDYVTYFDLLESPDDWQLTRLGSMTAVFYRNDVDDPTLREYVATHRADFAEQAFRTDAADATSSEAAPREWARSRSVYEKYLSRPTDELPNAIGRALHYQTHLQNTTRDSGSFGPDQSAALAYLSIRFANQGLAEHPQSAAGYRLLGGAYEFLTDLEARLSGGYPTWRRFFQTVQAYRQSLLIEPDHRLTHLKLAQFYFRNQKYDLALQAVQRYRDLAAEADVLSEMEIRARSSTQQLEQRLNDAVQQVKTRVDQRLEQGQDRLAVARAAHQAGCVLQSLKLIDDDTEPATSGLQVELFKARLLMEAGRAREAFDTLAQLESLAERASPGTGPAGMPWRSRAAMAGLANGRYDRAIRLWSSDVDGLRTQQLGPILQTMPLAGSPQQWPLVHMQASYSALYGQPLAISERLLNMALCQLEVGRSDAAATTFRRLLQVDPDSPLRPLVRFYLYLITEEIIDLQPPSDWIPITPDLFAPDRSIPEPVEAEKPAD